MKRNWKQQKQRVTEVFRRMILILAPEKKTLGELAQLDVNGKMKISLSDESLRKWKESLGVGEFQFSC